MTITHEHIAERMRAIEAEENAFRRRKQKEIESLVELCASIGHRFGQPLMTYCFSVDLGHRHGERHQCEACGHDDWVGQEPAWEKPAAKLLCA